MFENATSFTGQGKDLGMFRRNLAVDALHELAVDIGVAAQEAQKVVIKSQDIADNANGIVNNVKGMTSIGGTVEMFVDKYVNPKLKEKIKEKEAKSNGKSEK